MDNTLINRHIHQAPFFNHPYLPLDIIPLLSLMGSWYHHPTYGIHPSMLEMDLSEIALQEFQNFWALKLIYLPQVIPMLLFLNPFLALAIHRIFVAPCHR
jgi:hypothetical protein